MFNNFTVINKCKHDLCNIQHNPKEKFQLDIFLVEIDFKIYYENYFGNNKQVTRKNKKKMYKTHISFSNLTSFNLHSSYSQN